jgi:hypothetical protein
VLDRLRIGTGREERPLEIPDLRAATPDRRDLNPVLRYRFTVEI